jgi:hypothetical protein
MEMEKKDIFQHSSLFMFAVFLMILFSYIIFSFSFHNLEERYAVHNTHMLVDEIEDDQVRVISSSASYMALYAQYEIEDQDFGKVEERLSDDNFLMNHDVESLLIYNPSTNSLRFDHTISDVPPSSDLETYLASNPEAFSKSMEKGSLSGLVFFPERTLVVALESFTTGNGTYENDYLIVVSRTIDLKELGITQDGTISVVLEDIAPPFKLNEEVTGQIAGDTSIGNFEGGKPAGIVPLFDILGNPVKILKVGTMGQTASEGLQMITLLALGFIVVSSIELAIHIHFAKNMDYTQFSELVHGLGKIQKSGDLTSRIEIEGDDEVNWLANNVNHMLDSLEEKEGKYHSLF